MPRTDVFDDLPDRPADGPGTNFLLVGLDKRAGLSEREKRRLHVGGEACNCTDAMMLVHVSADQRRVSVVSVPRDSYVPFPREAGGARDSTTEEPAAREPAAEGQARPTTAGEQPEGRPWAGKINGAYDLGGPRMTVRTVEQATGVRIDHYLEADFASFVEAVDELGGATVCTDKPLRDRNSGLDLTAGTHRLDGRGALQYVRARHLPPSGDLGRMRRQQRFLAQLLHSFQGRGVFDDPAALAHSATALLDTLRADERLSAADLVTLGRALGKLDTERAEFATVPIADFDHRVPDWGSTLVWDRERADRLFAALRTDRSIASEEAYAQPAPGVPVAWAPGDIPVRVVAGPERAEAAGALERGLRGNGFPVRRQRAEGERKPSEKTEIVYAKSRQRQARSLAAALPAARLIPVPGDSKVFTVYPGRNQPEVVRVVHDRSSVQGAPASGAELDCG
ncbi:hypothetical protein AN216_09930 [Streptomyces oceani]|uniref:LytR family transcriptional regulator n=2 Tax=Streptomyces oceani TaxID=1075402 RepID=A0A1E7KJG5_9ACTN|nr:hypothetical protein AN216_09930 [Streptomyces oceani]